jgi:hypothetical protein
VEAAGGRYRANASHNAGILYHEYGHHITRHTADFQANALRKPQRQNNRKPAIDEGTSDYWAATMLGTPHIWAWHRRHDAQEIHPRSLLSAKTMADYDARAGADPHANGTIWAAVLWNLRTHMAAHASDGIHKTDLLVLQTLLLLGWRTAVHAETTRQVHRTRASFAEGLSALLDADELLYASRHHDTIVDCFSRRGIQSRQRMERNRDV